MARGTGTGAYSHETAENTHSQRRDVTVLDWETGHQQQDTVLVIFSRVARDLDIG